MARLIVQKFGGSSVRDIERIKKVAQHIIKTKQDGYNVVAVVSAMGNTTDQLLKMAYSISGKPHERELDTLLSTGEQVSISLLAIAIESLGEDVISLTGAQCGIITSDRQSSY